VGQLEIPRGGGPQGGRKSRSRVEIEGKAEGKWFQKPWGIASDSVQDSWRGERDEKKGLPSELKAQLRGEQKEKGIGLLT